jgi:hypothetical protein
VGQIYLIEEQLTEAVEVARWALEEARQQPTVKSKRGHDIANPMFRVYFEASGVATRWARELRHVGGEIGSVDDAIARILDEKVAEG